MDGKGKRLPYHIISKNKCLIEFTDVNILMNYEGELNSKDYCAQ